MSSENTGNENLVENEYLDQGKKESEADTDDAVSSKPVSEAGGKKSDVWNHFTKDCNYKENKRAKCNYCGISYTCTNGSTSNLNKHMKNKHTGRSQESIKDMFNVKAKVRRFFNFN